jgi:hypothetical protein
MQSMGRVGKGAKRRAYAVRNVIDVRTAWASLTLSPPYKTFHVQRMILR